MPELHALLSPSASSRWLVCTPSALAESEVPSEDSIFTREGTLAHAMAEYQLRAMLGEDMEKDLMKLDQTIMEEGYDLDEITGYIRGYVHEVWAIYQATREADPETILMPEVRVSVDKYAADCWGTSDIVIVGNRMIQVIDLKYGKGVKVSAIGNTQMRIYGLGAYLGYGDWLYDIDTVRMTIIQPRLGHRSTDQLPVNTLLGWAEEVLRPQAVLAGHGLGEREAGTHCRFCKLAGTCPALASTVNEHVSRAPEVDYLTPQEMAMALAFLPVAKNWINQLEAAATDKMLKGEDIPGYKVVEGRSLTKISDSAGLLKALLAEGFKKSDLYREPELKGITDLKKLVGAKRFTEIAQPFSSKAPGKPTIAEADDKRDSLNTNTLGKQMFG